MGLGFMNHLPLPKRSRKHPRAGVILPWLVILVLTIVIEMGPFNLAHWRTAGLGAEYGHGGETVSLADARIGSGLTRTDANNLVVAGDPAPSGSPGISVPTTDEATVSAIARANDAQASVVFPLPDAAANNAVRTITIDIAGSAQNKQNKQNKPSEWRGNTITIQTRTSDGQWRDISQGLWLDRTSWSAPQRVIVYSSGDVTRRVTLNVPGTDAVRLTVLDAPGSPVRLSGITVNAPVPFTVEPLRVLLIIAVLSLLWIFRPSSRIYAISAIRLSGTPEKTTQRLGFLPPVALAMTALVVIESVVFVAVAVVSWRGGAYTGTFRSDGLGHWVNRDQYPLLANALLHGRLWLDLPVDPRLAALPNPYDFAARRAIADQGASMYWDYAYFQGRYYSYFGVLPALLLFAPVKAFTGHDLPTPVAVMFLGVLAIVLMALLTLLIARRWFAGRISLGMCLLLTAGFTVGSNVFYLARVPSLYSVPIAGSLALTLGALICWIMAKGDDNDKEARPRAGWLAFGSLLMACNLVSRPQFLAFSVLGVALFWNEIIHERTVLSMRDRPSIRATVATTLPFLIVGLLLGWYDFARFGSPFDLGASHNLTGYDMSALRPSLDLLSSMLFIDWFQPVNLTTSFPFIHVVDTNIAAPVEPSLGGVFAQFPLSVLALGLWWVRRPLHQRRIMGVSGTLLAVAAVVSVVDAVIGGVNNRYDCDFAWAASLAAVPVAMCIVAAIDRDAPRPDADPAGGPTGDSSAAVHAFRVVIVTAVLLSIVICVFGWFTVGRLSPWISTNPNLYATVAALIGQ